MCAKGKGKRAERGFELVREGVYKSEVEEEKRWEEVREGRGGRGRRGGGGLDKMPVGLAVEWRELERERGGRGERERARWREDGNEREEGVEGEGESE